MKSKDEDNVGITTFFFLIAIMGIIWFVISITAFNNIEPRDIGQYMCLKHNYTLKTVDTNMYWGQDNIQEGDNRYYFKVTCKNKDQESIDDGYLVIEK